MHNKPLKFNIHPVNLSNLERKHARAQTQRHLVSQLSFFTVRKHAKYVPQLIQLVALQMSLSRKKDISNFNTDEKLEKCLNLPHHTLHNSVTSSAPKTYYNRSGRLGTEYIWFNATSIRCVLWTVCDTMQIGTQLPSLQRNVLPSTSRWISPIFITIAVWTSYFVVMNLRFLHETIDFKDAPSHHLRFSQKAVTSSWN
jgi:hypothetical protein